MKTSDITRRYALKIMGLTALAGFSNSVLAENKKRKRPNLIFILTDDQRYDAMANVGKFPWLKTPNLDKLVAQGTRFDNAFVTTSLCSPSRASFLTGCYANRHGVIINGTLDPKPEIQTFPQVLQKAGYETAYIGKWHMAPGDHARPGYDHWVSFNGQGRYYDCPMNDNGRKYTAEKYITDELTDHTVKFIKMKHEKPFMIYLSHKAVHGPFTPASRHEDLYTDIVVEPLDDPNDVIEDKPKWMKETMIKGRGTRKVVPPTSIFKNYMRGISAVDDGIGRILDTLEQKGILDDTVIVFAGDNGFFFREHGGLGDKRKAYEESMRIPLIMRYPKIAKAGTKNKDLVLNIDIAPTFLDLAGAKIPKSVQGQSWIPQLTHKAKGRESFLYEYYDEHIYRNTEQFASTPTSIAIRTKKWKLITFPELIDEIDELYDMQNDPKELRNLFKKPEYYKVRLDLSRELEILKRQISYVKPMPIETGK
jgi:arylsulfatase A-like enzyme